MIASAARKVNDRFQACAFASTARICYALGNKVVTPLAGTSQDTRKPTALDAVHCDGKVGLAPTGVPFVVRHLGSRMWNALVG
jgi:hypothetical protein